MSIWIKFELNSKSIKSLFLSYWQKRQLMLTFWVRLIFMADKFSRKAWSGSAHLWIRARSGRSRCRSHTAGSALVTKDQHLSHGSGSQEKNERISSEGQISWSFFSGHITNAGSQHRCASEARTVISGVEAEPRGLNVRVKFRGPRSGEGQGYGQVGLVMRSHCPAPLREAFKWPSLWPDT